MSNNLKSVLIVSAVFPPEPVVSAMISYALAKKLSEFVDVTVICPEPTRPNGKHLKQMDFSNEKFKRVVLNTYTHPASDFVGRMKESISLGRASAEYIEKNHENIGCIYINTWPIFAQYFTLDVAKRYKIKTVLHIQDVYPESMLPRLGFIGSLIRKPLLFLDKSKINKADMIFAISNNMKSYLSTTRGIDSNRIEVIRNWQDDSLFEERLETKTDKFTFMFVGSISPAAGVLFLLKSFVKLGNKNARLVIAGDGSDKKECMDFASQNPQADIQFCEVSPETVPAVQANAHVMLLPLKKGVGATASPSKLPAYMYSAKPIIASVDANTDVEQVILESGGGWVCPAEDENQLIGLMKQVFQMPLNVLEEKGVSARDFALAHFTMKTNLDLMVKKITMN